MVWGLACRVRGTAPCLLAMESTVPTTPAASAGDSGARAAEGCSTSWWGVGAVAGPTVAWRGSTRATCNRWVPGVASV